MPKILVYNPSTKGNLKELTSVIKDTSQSIEGVAKAGDDMAHGAAQLAQNSQSGTEKLEEALQ